MGARPRLLVVPGMTPLEWPILPLLEEWADVATFETPGVGDTPGSGRWDPVEAVPVALRAVDERGWDRYVIVADEWAVLNAVHVARARPESVQALALGHPALDWRGTGPRPPIMAEVRAAFVQTAAHDRTVWARHMTQVTDGHIDDATMDAIVERTPGGLVRDMFQVALDPHPVLGETLTSLDVPMLFVRHVNCLLWTQEGFEDAVAAVPSARAAELPHKPSASPAFSELLREFCADLASAPAQSS